MASHPSYERYMCTCPLKGEGWEPSDDHSADRDTDSRASSIGLVGPVAVCGGDSAIACNVHAYLEMAQEEVACTGVPDAEEVVGRYLGIIEHPCEHGADPAWCDKCQGEHPSWCKCQRVCGGDQ